MFKSRKLRKPGREENQQSLSVAGTTFLTEVSAKSTEISSGRNDAKIFLREFTRELFREISPAAKALALLAVIVSIGTAVYVGQYAFNAYHAQQQQTLSITNAQSKKIDDHDKRLANLNERVGQTDRQLADLTKAESDLSDSNKSVLRAISLPSQLWSMYGRGVCLIAGSYILVDQQTGKPLRYSGDEQNTAERILTEGLQPPLTTDGQGTIFQLDFVGTGFHVGGGYVLTNRHIASDPWDSDKRAQVFVSSLGAQPRLQKLVAFFPGHEKPLALKLKTMSGTDDIAVCKVESGTVISDIPALPLAPRSTEPEIGRPVVMMGYPTGPNRLLALLSEQEATALDQLYGDSLVKLLSQLGKRKLINPQTTQGHITDLYKSRIVFDAATTEGSSGTPMFGESGEVIGITFAIMVDNGASNLAVAIDSTNEQLRKAGWNPSKSH